MSNYQNFINEVLSDKRIVRTAFLTDKPAKHINVKAGKAVYSNSEIEEILFNIQELKQALGVPKNAICTDFIYKRIKMKPILTAYLTQPQYCRAMLQIKACQASKSMLVFENLTEKAILGGFSKLKTDIEILQKKYSIIFE